MNNFEIKFQDIKRVSTAIQKGNDKVLSDYLNTFKGENTFEKFKNILKVWSSDVSYTLNLNLNDKPTKIQVDYIISEIPDDLGTELKIKEENIELILDIPKSFDIISLDIIPIYSLIYQISSKYCVEY